MRLGVLVFGIVMCSVAAPGGAKERMTLKVSPLVAFAPAHVVVRAMVEADADNRAITIVAESQDFYRSSEIQLDGDHAPRTNTFEFRSLPSGTYHVRATLIGADKEARATVHQLVNVVSNGAGH